MSSTPEGSIRERILIRTKMNRPQLPPRHVVRPRLLQQLEESSSRRITLISAPAGFGKTTLAVQWLEGSPRNVAWISLDTPDSDPDRFSRYLVEALQAALPGCVPRSAALLGTVTPPPQSYFSEVLVSELGQIDSAVLLVFDDYQSVGSGPVDELVSRMVEHLPESLRLLLLSRADPLLPLARWRAKGWLSEIRQRDLRFKMEEVRAFFADVSSKGLSDADLGALNEKTEGWIAGLQLAKLSILGAEDPQKSVERFSGSDRLIADFLADEVLAGQPPEVRDLLAVTAHLERFCSQLCERLLPENPERPSAADLLARMERENLFLVPLDTEHRWFRYHSMFGHLLAHHIPEAASEDSRRDTARRAAEWFAEEGLVKEALRLWIDAGELDAAATHLGSQLDAILDEDYSRGVLSRLLALFPPGAEHGRLPLLVAHTYLAHELFDLPRLAALLEEADVCRGYDPRSGEPQIGDFRADLDAERAVLHMWRAEPEKAIAYGERALKWLPSDDIGLARLEAEIYTAASLHLMGRREECLSFLQDAIRSEDARGGKRSGGMRNVLAYLYFRENDLTDAHMVAQQAADALEAHLTDRYFLGENHYLLGALALERDILAEAAEGFERIADLRYLVVARVYQDALIGLALVAERQGDGEALARWTRDARSVAAEIGSEDCLRAAESFERRLAALAGLPVSTLPAPTPALDAVSPWLEVPSITHAEILVTHPDAEIRQGALPYIDQAITAMEAVFNARQVLRLSVLRAAALAEVDRLDDAFGELDRALIAAEPQGSIRPFLGGGERTTALLLQLANRGSGSDFLERVLRAVERGTPAGLPSRPKTETASPVGVLTLRDLETLELLAERFSDKEIAAKLRLRPEAVKKRVARIYTKLDVHDRREAVVVAVERGLLKTRPS